MAKLYIQTASIPKPSDLGSTPWQLTNLSPVTVIFGKNGSGKSRLLRAWRDQNSSNNHYIVPERSGDLSYQPNILTDEMDGPRRREHGTRNYLNDYRQLPGNPDELETQLATLLPDFSVAISGRSNPPYKILRATGGEVPNIDHLSSGEAQLLTVALDILTVAAMWDMENRAERLMLIDEPDAHIHPDLQVRFADFLQSVASRYSLQIVVATHSTTLLAAIGQFCDTEAGVVYADRSRSTLAVQPFTKYKRELAACLGGHALMGPLFGVPLLLVEGDDDFRIWSQVPRHHVVSLAVLPCNGDEIFKYQKDLELLFDALREDKSKPAGYALLDGDKKIPGKVQPNVPFIRLDCHETENLYLCDEVLALFGKSWAAASADIVAAAPRFPANQARLATAASWDRQTVDLKGLMLDLMEILDSKKVHWTIRVSRAIGMAKPTGQLATFLSNDLIQALWP